MQKSNLKPGIRLTLLGLLALIIMTALAACGESNTPTTVATAPSPEVATTAPSGTTVAVTSGTNTGGSFSNNKFNLPGLTPVTLDPTLEKVLKDYLSLSNSNIPDLGLFIYTSNDEPAILGENADKTLTTAGYAFHDVRGGNNTAFVTKDNDGVGAYTKSGAADIIVEARDSKALTDIKDNPPGVSPEVYQKMIDQVKDKKSVLITLTGTNLYQAIVEAQKNSPVRSGPNLTPTPAPTK